MKKKVLITGASGMLGATLVKAWQGIFEIYATGRENFQNNPAEYFLQFDLLSWSYKKLLKWADPDIIVHCAAVTNVDYCEEHPDMAIELNGESVKKFLSSGSKAKLIFISSDAVFPENVHMATEKDKTDPQNVYGRSKEIGELFVKEKDELHCTIRTTILGKNINPSKEGFVEWFVNSVKEGKKITLFNDILFTPITIWHFAEELQWVIENDVSGVIHISGKEPVTKYDFGMSLCKKLGFDTTLIANDSIDKFNFKARRSKDQTLDSSYYKSISGRRLPTKDESIHILAKNFKEESDG